MTRYFLRSLGAHFRSGRLLFLLSLLGVALGVASVLSIQILNRNALAAFEGTMQAVSGEAQLTVLGQLPTFPEERLPGVLAVPGVETAWPLLRVDVALDGHEGLFLEVIGVDLFAPARFPWKGDAADPAVVLTTPGWAAVTPALAAEMGWEVGDGFGVSLGTRRAELRVGALVDFQRISPLASRRLVVMDVAQAQHLLGRRGELHQIDVRLREGAEVGEVRERLQARLGPGFRVVTPEQRRAEAGGLVAAFRMNLTALSLVSLFVGGFLVYSSTQAALVRRRGELGLLRSLGTTRAGVLGLILGEAAFLGLLGTAVGLPLGWAAARWNVGVVSGTLTNLYLLEGIETLTLPPWLFVLGIGVGLFGAVGGALPPALDLATRHPRDLLAAYTLHERFGAGAPRLFAAGLALQAGVWVAFAAGARGWRPYGFVLGIAILATLALASPLVVQRLARIRRARSFGMTYGMRTLGLRIQTTSMAVAALAVAVTMLVGITIMVGSFRTTLEVWMSTTTRADVYLTSLSWRQARSDAGLDPDLVREIETVEGVRMVDRLRAFRGYTGDRPVAVAGIVMDAPSGVADRFRLLEGDAGEAVRRAAREEAVLISEPLARKTGLGAGDVLPIEGPRGTERFDIAGVYYDYSSETGAVLMDLRALERRFGPGPVQSLALYLASGVDPEEMVGRLREEFAGEPLEIRSNRTLREDAFAIFEQTFAVTRLLQGMSLLIAVSGVTLALLVLARERIAELALYRALGAARPQLFRVFLGKGLGLAAFGCGLGLVGGVGLALLLVYVINRAFFGWTIAMSWPFGELAVQALTIVAAAGLASVYPAVRASRTPATELSREDL